MMGTDPFYCIVIADTYHFPIPIPILAWVPDPDPDPNRIADQ